MVAKSIAKMYTNIHKPTDYNFVVLEVEKNAFKVSKVNLLFAILCSLVLFPLIPLLCCLV